MTDKFFAMIIYFGVVCVGISFILYYPTSTDYKKQ